jgi:hypothetical protein
MHHGFPIVSDNTILVEAIAVMLSPSLSRRIGVGGRRGHGQTRRMRVMPPFDAVTPGIGGWRVSTAASARPRFFRVREGLGLHERFVARADCLGEPVLIEFGRLRLPLARRDVFGDDGDGLEAGFRDGERRGGRARGLEADLLQGVGE